MFVCKFILLVFSGGDSLLFSVFSVPVFMGSEQEAGGSLSPELAAVLDAQRNAILTAVNAQIQGLQTNLLQAQSNLAVQIASDLQPDTYVFKKKGNEQQFSFNRKVAKTSGTALNALESGNIPKAKEELNKGISLINSSRQYSFVEGAISELMSRGCLREASENPQFCNPLHVAVQSSGKLRLILDLSHLNKFVVKKSVNMKI